MSGTAGKRIRKVTQMAGLVLFTAFMLSPFSAGAAQAEAESSLTSLRQSTQEAGDLLAVAYLGFGTDFASYMAGSDTYGSYLKEYAFLADIPKERWLDAGGYEIYAVVPADSSYTVSVYSFSVDETNDYRGAVGERLWRVEEGKPFLLCCNVSDIMPNVSLILEGGNGNTLLEYEPGLSLKDGSLWTNQKRIYDFTLSGEPSDYEAGSAAAGGVDGNGITVAPGTGGSPAASENPAVSGGREVYADLISKYTEAMNAVLSGDGFDLLEALGSENYEPLYGGEAVGYLFRDLDGNGQEELIFIRQYDFSLDSYVQDVYTYAGGETRHLVSGWVRNRFLLCSDGSLYQRGSSGAADSFSAVWRMNDAGDELVRSEIVQYKNEDLLGNMTDELHTYYCSMAEGTKKEISREEADSRVMSMESHILMPREGDLQMIVTKAK